MEAKQESPTLLKRSGLHGLPVAALVLALLAYWFGVADREPDRATERAGDDAGPGVPVG